MSSFFMNRRSAVNAHQCKCQRSIVILVCAVRFGMGTNEYCHQHERRSPPTSKQRSLAQAQYEIMPLGIGDTERP
jgi:hypothetical protein